MWIRDDPPGYAEQVRFTEGRRQRRAAGEVSINLASSDWRMVPVFWKVLLSWVRTVCTDRKSLSAICCGDWLWAMAAAVPYLLLTLPPNRDC